MLIMVLEKNHGLGRTDITDIESHPFLVYNARRQEDLSS